MSNISSTDTLPVKLMRWAARFLSIPWAYWALFWTWFVLAHFLPTAVLVIIMIIPLLLFMGAAIIASVWGKEALGGGVLLVDGVLLIVCFLVAPHIEIRELTGFAVVAFFTMVLPALVAGSLFLACHRITKTSGEQHV